MTGVTLKGLADDGTHLILVGPDGADLRLPITDELREAMRHARVTRPADAPRSTLTPREIQQRIRSGLNAAELAQLTGEPLAAIQKFEAPVLAERAYIVQMAQGCRVGHDATSPVLGDLVADRLAGRGVDPAAVTWDAWREPDEPWKVAVDFRVDTRTLRALWLFDHTSRTLTAQDDEAAWLTETELLEAPIPRRHLSAVRGADQPLAPSRPAAPENPPEVQDPTEALLEDLQSRRGVRETIDLAAMDEDDDDDEAFSGFGPAAARDDRPRAAGHPAGTARQAPGDAAPAPEQAREAPPAEDETRTPGGGVRRPRKGRASVPSWDEIVFGAKNEER